MTSIVHSIDVFKLHQQRENPEREDLKQLILHFRWLLQIRLNIYQSSEEIILWEGTF